MQDKYIGLALAISSSLAIGSSFVITKKGLIDAAERHSGYSSESYAYLRNATWWVGMLTMAIGEVANFAAYTFAPAILVTPLGAFSVLIGAILASFFLGEELGKLGRIGCALCFVGSLIIVLHAPEDKEVQTVDEILTYAMQPGFLFYIFLVVSVSVFLIFRVAPTHGTRTPLVYISICSLVGSLSIMAIKGFGVAIKLTLSGNNQLTHFSTYIFGITVVCCIAIQMNYFNKALDLFSTNIVNPIYYVFFTSATTIASLILFQGYGASGGVNMISLMTGYVVIFIGVYMLNGRDQLSGRYERAEDANRGLGRHSLLETRQSMSIGARLSMDSDGHLPLSATPGSGFADRRSFSGSRDQEYAPFRSPAIGSQAERPRRKARGPPAASNRELKEVLYDADEAGSAATTSNGDSHHQHQPFMLNSGSDIEEEDEPQSDAASTTSRTPVSPGTRQASQYQTT